MAPFEDFIHVSTGASGAPGATSSSDYGVPSDYFENAGGKRPNATEAMLFNSMRANHPKHQITITATFAVDFLAFGQASDEVTYFPRGSPDDIMATRQYVPPARRYNDDQGGAIAQRIQFGCYDYVYKHQAFILYIAEGTGPGNYYAPYNYVLIKETETEGKAALQQKVDELMAAATKYAQELHDEVLVFDQGSWQKNKELWRNVRKASWEDVILETEKKEAIIEDILGFFDAQDKYEEFNVPWKRGVIFYGPPGNGKTISTKALMNDVLHRKDPSVECLYVKTFSSFGGPEYSIRQIFLKARQMAPCLLIFEDIDSLVSVSVRSYFLNEVDGLESNHGILMIGSTNHLERLDPGIAKRPSRFDRKYIFENPTREERIQYCEYWRNKLSGNKKITFPEEMKARIADITADFSFAYMKEAFVAALLVIVARTGHIVTRYGEDPLSGNVFWKEIKRQVENLRKEMEEETDAAASSSLNMGSGMWPALSTILDEQSPSQHPTRPMDIRPSVMPRYM